MLTAKEIEEARERLKTRVEHFCQAVEMEEGAKAAAFDDIDALCAAAGEPESLVGRKVRLLGEHETAFSRFGVITEGPLEFYRVDTAVEQDIGLLRGDFELLEGDNG